MLKLTDRECIAQRVALSMVELRCTEERRNLLISIGEHHKHDLAVNEEELQVLRTLLGKNRLMDADVEGDRLMQQSMCKEELAELAITVQEASHIQEAVKLQESPQGGWHVPSSFNSGYGDNDAIYSDDSSNDSSDDSRDPYGDPVSCTELHGPPGCDVLLMEHM